MNEGVLKYLHYFISMNELPSKTDCVTNCMHAHTYIYIYIGSYSLVVARRELDRSIDLANLYSARAEHPIWLWQK